MPAAESGAAMTSHRIDFIDKNDGGSNLFRLFKQISYSTSADADKHLHKVAAADREERNASFTRNSFGKQRLACAGRSDQ